MSRTSKKRKLNPASDLPTLSSVKDSWQSLGSRRTEMLKQLHAEEMALLEQENALFAVKVSVLLAREETLKSNEKEIAA